MCCANYEDENLEIWIQLKRHGTSRIMRIKGTKLKQQTTKPRDVFTRPKIEEGPTISTFKSIHPHLIDSVVKALKDEDDGRSHR